MLTTAESRHQKIQKSYVNATKFSQTHGWVPLCRQKKFAVAADILPLKICRQNVAVDILPPTSKNLPIIALNWLLPT